VKPVRVSQNLNQALHDLLAARPELLLLGADIADPYGGAFKVTRGLSTRFPDRVLSTPVSEAGMVGLAAGLAFAGQGAVVEIMFGDFATLAFDQLANFASKSVSMYGRRVPMPMLVRCPSGAGRGYGPTHSQSLQKHFIGLPGLSLYEVSPFHDSRPLLPSILDRAEPAMLFEDKLLYPERMYTSGTVDDVFSFDFIGDVARVFAVDPDTFDCLLIVPGGLAHHAVQAARSLLLEDELSCQILVPSRLYPFDVVPLLPILRRTGTIGIAEPGTAGGTWGSEVAHHIHRHLWTDLDRPVVLMHAPDSVIPTARHLEDRFVVRAAAIRRAIASAVHG
jgi:pyruvate dehydrogenase E1 component beta subunit